VQVSASRKEREALLVAAARKASRYFRSVICLRSTRPCSQIATIYTMQSLFTPPPPRSATSFARAVSRRSPQRSPPCVFCSPTLFSACSQHTGSPACVWWLSRPWALFSALAFSAPAPAAWAAGERRGRPNPNPNNASASRFVRSVARGEGRRQPAATHS
jgi:hypothetical protein